MAYLSVWDWCRKYSKREGKKRGDYECTHTVCVVLSVKEWYQSKIGMPERIEGPAVDEAIASSEGGWP